MKWKINLWLVDANVIRQGFYALELSWLAKTQLYIKRPPPFKKKIMPGKMLYVMG